MSGAEELEPVEAPWAPPATTSREFTQDELDATRMYLSEIGFSPLLTAQEEVYFARLVIRGDASARNRMVESNLRLVVKIARRYMNPVSYTHLDVYKRQSSVWARSARNAYSS